MFAITLLILWIACMPVNYLLSRREQRKLFDQWTKADRLFALIMSLFGPFALLVNVLIALLIKLAQSKWANKEARW